MQIQSGIVRLIDCDLGWFRVLSVVLLIWACSVEPSLAQSPTPTRASASDTLSGFHSYERGARTTIPTLKPIQPTTLNFYAGAIWTANLGYHLNQNVYSQGSLCGIFTNGTSAGPGILLGTAIPFIARGIALEPELAYQNLSTNYSLAFSANAYQPGSGLVPVKQTATYSATLSALSLGVLLDYTLLDWLHIAAGPQLGTFLNHSYNETERINTPSTAYYTTPGNTALAVSAGSLAVNTLQSSFALGVRFRLPLPGIDLWPEIRGSVPLTSISSVNASPWKTYTLGGGITLWHNFTPEPVEEPPPEQVPVVATVTAPAAAMPPAVSRKSTSIFRVRVHATGIGKHGEQIEEPVLTVERVHVTEAYPTLNYVFFDDGSPSIASRYHTYASSRQTETFDEKAFERADALTIHHSILDVIGSRLRNHPEASISVVGSRSQASPLDHAASNQLALDRAKGVADYLERIWNITPNRISIRSGDLPELPSDESTPTGQAENRRVEILSNSNAILAPLWATRLEHIATPPKLLFSQSVNRPIASCKISIKQGDKILQTFDGTSDGAAGQHLWTLDERSVPEDSGILVYTDVVTDSLGDSASASGMIPLRREEHDTSLHTSETRNGKQIERYSLILFDYSSSQFGKRQGDLMIDTIASTINANSELTLTGHTDQTGDPDFNDRLSGMRANATATKLVERLKKKKRAIPPMSVEAHGARDLLFDNALPEGRFLSRTVRITIEHEE